MMKCSFKLFLVLIAMILTAMSLSATQAFWSMEPSSQAIDRADSLTGFDIEKYEVHLTINEQTHYINGTVKALVIAESPLSSISYELTGGSLAVSQVLVNDTPTAFTHQNGIITIPLSIPQGGVFTTQVSYAGVPGNSPAPYNIGLIFMTNTCYTLSNPDAGRYFWPSYDHPWDKAMIDWYLTVRSDWLAAANGTRLSITDNGNGTRTHFWQSQYPIATYVMGFAAGPYIEYPQNGDIPIQNFVLAGQLANAQVDFANLPEMISFFSDTFGAYPFEKYGHMVVNMATYAAMEHQTMTTFGSQYLTGDQNYESIVAHELAHQWYGNYLTPITMREVWLKESFATYSEFLWEAYHHGWNAGCDYLSTDIQQYYISWENTNGAHTIFNPEYNLMFAPPTYEKSASVLHMLRLKMGNPSFFSFIRALLTTYPNGNLSTTEFIALAEQISGLDLEQFFLQWIYSPGIPNAEFTVFHNGAGTGKIIAKSTSPTTTRFFLDVPILITGSASPDSLLIVASPDGQTNYFPYNIANDFSTIAIDPNHWVLKRTFTQNSLRFDSCLPYQGGVDLSWSAFPNVIPISGYHIYRRTLPSGTYSRINQQIVNGLIYTDTNVMNGSQYEYYIVGVDAEGYISLPSNHLQAMPIAFPFDQGILVVDETRNGTGSAISPNDQMVDEFYARCLAGINTTIWDYDMQGIPSLSVLSHYPLILWHCDDFSGMQIIDNLSTLGSYVLSGGKLIISGWKYPSTFTTAFINRFLPGIGMDLHNSAVFVAANSGSYQALHPDPTKLAASWNEMLPMTYTFTGDIQSVYTAEIYQGGTGNGDATAIRIDQTGEMILLGFPLYFMLETEVSSFLHQIIGELYPPSENEDLISPPETVEFSSYPNPARFGSSLTLSIRNAKPQSMSIYNMRGQRVYYERELEATKSSYGYEIISDRELFYGLSTGCYIIRLGTDKGDVLRKIMLMK